MVVAVRTSSGVIRMLDEADALALVLEHRAEVLPAVLLALVLGGRHSRRRVGDRHLLFFARSCGGHCAPEAGPGSAAASGVATAATATAALVAAATTAAAIAAQWTRPSTFAAGFVHPREAHNTFKGRAPCAAFAGEGTAAFAATAHEFSPEFRAASEAVVTFQFFRAPTVAPGGREVLQASAAAAATATGHYQRRGTQHLGAATAIPSAGEAEASRATSAEADFQRFACAHRERGRDLRARTARATNPGAFAAPAASGVANGHHFKLAHARRHCE